jgi:GxxExxY protein
MTTKFLFPDLSHNILGIAFKVYNRLGLVIPLSLHCSPMQPRCGLPENCYKLALMIEFEKENIKAQTEVITKVYYDKQQIGYFKSDIVVDNKIILELKSIDKLTDKNKAQVLTYLKVSNIRIGYLINFGNISLEYKRLII